MSESAQTASRSRASAGVSPGNSPSVQRARAGANCGTRAQRQAEQLRALDQRVEIALRVGQLGIEPALAQAQGREHDPLRRQMLEHAVEHQGRRRQGTGAAAGTPGMRRELGRRQVPEPLGEVAGARAASSE